MEILTNKEALDYILDGGMVVFSDRYYRYSKELNRFEYSDYSKTNWKPSNETKEKFLKGTGKFVKAD